MKSHPGTTSAAVPRSGVGRGPFTLLAALALLGIAGLALMGSAFAQSLGGHCSVSWSVVSVGETDREVEANCANLNGGTDPWFRAYFHRGQCFACPLDSWSASEPADDIADPGKGPSQASSQLDPGPGFTLDVDAWLLDCADGSGRQVWVRYVQTSDGPRYQYVPCRGGEAQSWHHRADAMFDARQ